MQIPNNGEWTFESAEIARSFDGHVREQLPWYDLATGIVSHVILHYLPQDGILYDIGASTGNITRSAKEILVARNAKVFSVEQSIEMCKEFCGYGELIKDSAENVDYQEFDVAILFLTLMFVPVSHRSSLLNKLVTRLKVGGCIIIFDKTPPNGGYLSTVMYRLTLAGKVANGASSSDIIKKELSLSGCQRPYDCKEDGAVNVFRFGDFAGWVIEKNAP